MCAATTAACSTGSTACSCRKGLSLFSQILSPRFANSLSLLTGALPAQYGLRTAGVVDIGVKSGTTNPGAEASFMGGSYNWVQPSAAVWRPQRQRSTTSPPASTSATASASRIRRSAWTPIHDDTAQWYGLAKVTGIVDENTRLSFIAGGASARFQIPNNPDQVPDFTVFGNSDLEQLDPRPAPVGEAPTSASPRCRRATQDVNMQLSGFARYSSLAYQPDAIGDLLYNGIAPWANAPASPPACRATAAGRSRPATRCAAASWSSASASPASPTPIPCRWSPTRPIRTRRSIPGDQPVGFTDGSDLIGWTYSVYLQDEWKVVPTVTVNFGAALRCHHRRHVRRTS